jgi:hypothetical protein
VRVPDAARRKEHRVTEQKAALDLYMLGFREATLLLRRI